jgi:hypothetical protein
MAIDKTSQLDMIVQKIARQGARYQPAVPGGLLVACGCLGLLLCSWGIASSLLQIFAPAEPVWFPRCPGNPNVNLVALSIFLIPSCLAIIFGRRKTDAIIVNDLEIRLTSRFGQQVTLPWRDLRESHSVGEIFQLICLTNGRSILAPNMHVTTRWRMDILMSLPSLLSPYLSESEPRLSAAYARLKLALMGPGVAFPVGDPDRYEKHQRQIFVYCACALAAAFFAFIGFLSNTGPAVGLAPVILSPVMDWLMRRGPRNYDHVTLTMRELHVVRGGMQLPAIKTENIKSTRIEDGLAIICKDKSESITLQVDRRSATLLAELIKTASSQQGLRLVRSKAKSAA